MKKSVVILVIVLVVTTAIVGIIARNGSIGSNDDADTTVQIMEVEEAADVGVEPAVEPVAPVNNDAGDTGEIVEDSSNLSRGYIDVDQSGDWSEGDIPLETCDDGYIVPVE